MMAAKSSDKGHGMAEPVPGRGAAALRGPKGAVDMGHAAVDRPDRLAAHPPWRGAGWEGRLAKRAGDESAPLLAEAEAGSPRHPPAAPPAKAATPPAAGPAPVPLPSPDPAANPFHSHPTG